MTNDNETVDGILKEMRDRDAVRKVRLRQYGGVRCNCSIAPDDVPSVYADRLEAAHNREVEMARIAACSAQAMFDEELAAHRCEVAELRKCLKEAMVDAVAEYKNNSCFKNVKCGEIKRCETCKVMRWRKVLEGGVK